MASSLSCSLVPLLTTRSPVPSHSVPGPVTVALERSRSDGMSLSFSPRYGFHLRGSRFFSLGSLPPRKAGHRSPMRGHSGGGPGTRNEAAASENPPLPTNRNTHNFLEKEPPPSLCALFENSGDVAGRAGVDGVCYGGSLEEEQPTQVASVHASAFIHIQ